MTTSAGETHTKRQKNTGLLDDGQVNFAKAIGRDESEIKDLLEVAVYKSIIETKFRVSLDNPKFRGKKKWSDRIHDIFKVHGRQWDDSIERKIKYLVSQAVIISPEGCLSDRDKTIIDALIMAIEGRLKEKEKAQSGRRRD
jgi:putative ATP-dependent endonuclease of OLD family